MASIKLWFWFYCKLWSRNDYDGTYLCSNYNYDYGPNDYVRPDNHNCSSYLRSNYYHNGTHLCSNDNYYDHGPNDYMRSNNNNNCSTHLCSNYNYYDHGPNDYVRSNNNNNCSTYLCSNDNYDCGPNDYMRSDNDDRSTHLRSNDCCSYKCTSFKWIFKWIL